MRFGDPQAFWLLLLVPLSIGFYIWAFRRRRRALADFGSPALMEKLTSATSWVRQGVKSALMVGGVLFLVLALVQPQYGTKLELIHRRGVDVIVALDTSLSMLAEDIKPDRLERARYEVQTLIDRLDGDRIGLVVFAGQAFVLCPLTLDYGAAKLLLDTVNTNTVPVKGTAIADAIRTATKAFDSSEHQYKALILITDGEDHEGDPIQAAKEAADAGVRIFTVGMGTPEGELIPIRKDGQVDYLKDREGRIVKTRLDETTLRKIASLTGGAYFRAQPGGVGLNQVYDVISKMKKKDLGSRKYTQYKHRYQWPLALALVCFAGEAFLSDRRKQKEAWRGRFQ